MQKYVNRPEYLDFLKRWQNRQIIKVVSGVRRAGKSTLFYLFRNYLKEHEGVKEEQFISINFENMKYDNLRNAQNLYDYLENKILPDQMNYIFLDEIQHVKEFERVVDSLFLKDNVDIYLTGSNAYFLSSEIATLLTGRYVELKILPYLFLNLLLGINKTTGLLITMMCSINILKVHFLIPYLLILLKKEMNIFKAFTLQLS